MIAYAIVVFRNVLYDLKSLFYNRSKWELVKGTINTRVLTRGKKSIAVNEKLKIKVKKQNLDSWLNICDAIRVTIFNGKVSN